MKCSPQVHVLNAWSLDACRCYFGSSGNFRRSDLARESRSLGVAPGGILSLAHTYIPLLSIHHEDASLLHIPAAMMYCPSAWDQTHMDRMEPSATVG
jgi:hypothetical protein